MGEIILNFFELFYSTGVLIIQSDNKHTFSMKVDNDKWRSTVNKSNCLKTIWMMKQNRGNDKKHKKITVHQNVKIKGLMKIRPFWFYSICDKGLEMNVERKS